MANYTFSSNEMSIESFVIKKSNDTPAGCAHGDAMASSASSRSIEVRWSAKEPCVDHCMATDQRYAYGHPLRPETARQFNQLHLQLEIKHFW
jgi:hypothetical protein